MSSAAPDDFSLRNDERVRDLKPNRVPSLGSRQHPSGPHCGAGLQDLHPVAAQFSVVIANFPFSDEFWWLPAEQQSEEQAKKAKKRFAKEGYTDKYNRFTFGKPPASTGDWAFIQHIIASTTAHGRAGVVCPQGVLFRGQPKIEEETGEFDADGNPKIRRRKADDEYLIRKGLLDARLIDAVIALPLNIFYGAGVPACLLILSKDRAPERRDKVLFVYPAPFAAG